MSDPVVYLLSLKMSADGTLRPSEAYFAQGSDLPLSDDLRSYLAQHYQEDISTVEIGSLIYRSKIYRPYNEHDCCYVEVNEDLIPLQQEGETKPVSAEETKPFVSEAPTWDYSESLTPQESIFIVDSFIEPELEEIDGSGNSVARLPWLAFHQIPRLVLVGAPGAGKTTILRKLAIDCLERWQADGNRPYPIYVQMRNFQSAGETVGLASYDVARSLVGDREPAKGVALASSRYVLLLDGLDEVPEYRREFVSEAINSFAEEYRELSIVAATREKGYQWQFPYFRYVRALPFSLPKIKEWTFHRISETGVWHQFLSSVLERQELRELAGNPLLLSVMVSVFRRSSILPQNRSALLGSYVKALVDRWDAVRGVVRQRHSWAAPNRKEAALGQIAFNLLSADLSSFSIEDIHLSADREQVVALLDVCEKETGLFFQDRQSGRWSFTHKIFADYFAAKYLVDNASSLVELSQSLLNNDSWQDVWPLACGIAYDASPFLKFVLTKDNLSTETKESILAIAFEQDISVSNEIMAACRDFFIDNIRSELLHKQADFVVGDFAISCKVHKKEDFWRLRSLLRSVLRLRRSKLGAEIALWLSLNRSNQSQALELIFTDQGILTSSEDRGNSTLEVAIDRELQTLEKELSRLR